MSAAIVKASDLLGEIRHARRKVECAYQAGLRLDVYLGELMTVTQEMTRRLALGRLADVKARDDDTDSRYEAWLNGVRDEFLHAVRFHDGEGVALALDNLVIVAAIAGATQA